MVKGKKKDYKELNSLTHMYSEDSVSLLVPEASEILTEKQCVNRKGKTTQES